MSVLVTRPAGQAGEWVDGLRAAGLDAVALPLIGIEGPAHPAAVQAAWAGLAGYAMVMFVSPNAAAHFFALRPDGLAWPDRVPEAAAAVLPGWMFNVALFVHGAEASLAIGFIFVVHFFNGHLRPNKFPMDLVIFTGSVPEEELRHERAGQYERLSRSGQLGTLSVAAPSDAERRRGYIVGTIGLVLGLLLFGLILQAVL